MTPFPGRSGESLRAGMILAPTSKVNFFGEDLSFLWASMASQSCKNQTSCVPLAGVEDLAPEREAGKKLNVQASHEELTGLLVGETHVLGSSSSVIVFFPLWLPACFCLLLIILQYFT